MTTRREFLEGLAAATGAVVLLPVVTSCKSGAKDEQASAPPSEQPPQETKPTPEPAKAADTATPGAPPTELPEGWDAIAYNRERGNAGAIPESYRASINGPDGEKKHLGKHLPYQPKIEAKLVPEGYLALMWGDPDRGYAKHPNAVKGPDNNNEGHWYNWIRIRKASPGEAEELQSAYTNWPTSGDGDNGQYAAFGGDIDADGGRNTVYLAAVPKGLAKGDTIRIWAHCLTHGEYVDFLTVA